MKRINRRLFLSWLCVGASLALPHGQAAEEHVPCRITEWPEPDDAFPGKGPLQKAAWFKRLWTERRAAFFKSRDRDRNAIIFLGDSITQGWRELENTFHEWKVANRGISGDVTRGVLFRLQDDVLVCHPAAVVLLIGTNDLGLGGDPAQVIENIEEIVRRLRWARPSMPIIVCKLMPRQVQFAERIKQVNSALERIPYRYANCYVCDTWSIYALPDGSAPEDLFPDLLHPNAAGYERWAAALKPILTSLNIRNK